MSGWQHKSELEGLALSARSTVGVIRRGLSWCFTLVQPQRPELAASAVPRLWRKMGYGVGEGDGSGRDSGSWHQQAQIPIGQKLVQSAGGLWQLC